jgi:hypothetical protein
LLSYRSIIHEIGETEEVEGNQETGDTEEYHATDQSISEQQTQERATNENPVILGILRDLSNQVGDISNRLHSVEKTQSRVLVTSEKINNLMFSYPVSCPF